MDRGTKQLSHLPGLCPTAFRPIVLRRDADDRLPPSKLLERLSLSEIKKGMLLMPSSLLTTLRSMARSPSYLIASMIVLATSIAAQVTLTSVVDAMLLRPSSGNAPSQLALVQSTQPGGIVSYPDYLSLLERSRSFSSLFAFERPGKISFSTGDDMTSVSYSLVSGNYFTAIGVQASIGRVLMPDDDVKGAAPVAVVSAALSRKFELKIGSVIKLNTTVFQVVGILPANYEDIEKNARTEIWIPTWQIGAVHQTWILTERNYQWIIVGGRLKHGVPFDQANSEMRTIGKQLQRDFPTTNLGTDLGLESVLRFRLAQDHSANAMLLLFGLGWFLFALAFANFFALTFVRLLNRRRELSIRLSLGASRADLGRWLLGELTIVSALSVAAGYGASLLFLSILRQNSHFADLLDRVQVQVDLRSLAVVVLAAIAGILIVWLITLRAVQRTDLVSAIRESATAPKRQRILVGLFALQFGIVLFMLSTAASLVGTLRDAAKRNYSFRTENLLFMDVNLRAAGHATNKADTQTFLRNMLDRIREVHGVTGVAAGTSVPLGRSGYTNIIIDNKDPAQEVDHNFVLWTFMTPDYIETLGLPLRVGRTINEHDVQGNPNVVMVDQTAAKRFWPEAEAIGKTFQPWPDGPRLLVIGVVANMPSSDESKPTPRIYIPNSVTDGAMFTLDIAVDHDSTSIRDQVQASLSGLWPYRNIPKLRSIQDQIQGSRDDLATTVQVTLWVVGFATLITTFGFYFFSAYTVSMTLKDAAVRLALGARRSEILKVHLLRFRWGVIGGFLIGTLLLFGGEALWAYFAVKITVPVFTSLATAAALLSVVAGVGLCLPLRRVAAMNSFLLLRSDVE